jgi:hypothetical protein
VLVGSDSETCLNDSTSAIMSNITNPRYTSTEATRWGANTEVDAETVVFVGEAVSVSFINSVMKI